MSSVPRVFCTELEYLQREETAEYKSEFYRGEVFAMTGGSPRHNIITGNLLTSFNSRLRGTRCRAFGSDQRIKIERIGMYTYPDLSIVCEPRQIDATDKNALVNPRVLIEVLSPSTESYDRTQKFRFYRHLPTLEVYVLVAQQECAIEVRTRFGDDRWEMAELATLTDVLRLSNLGIEIPLAEVYESVAFDEPTSGPSLVRLSPRDDDEPPISRS